MQEGAQWSAKRARLSFLSHDDIAKAYDDFEAERARNPKIGYEVPKGVLALGWQKLNYPTQLDLGIGKIRLHTAIRMLRDYNERYPNSDPLGIKKYNGAYDRLVADLEAVDAPTTAAFAAIVIAEGTRWFQAKAPNTWAKLNPSDQAALLIDYYNLGREAIEHRYQMRMKRDGRYTPGFGDSGDSHRANVDRVWRALFD